jgi:hypothetical protein
VWGTRTTTEGAEVDIRYHLAIDSKPPINLANKNMYALLNPDDIT